MCKFNRPYPVPFGQHPDDVARSNETYVRVRPQSEWQKRLAELSMDEVALINQAEQDAAAIAADVHLYRSATSTYVGIALKPSAGPTVKIWEH